MSYILEALKKAQAERQLGDLPSIHAPTFQSPAEAGQGRRLKKPLLLAVLGMGAVIAVLLVLLMRQAPQSVSLAQPASGAAPVVAVAPAAGPQAGIPASDAQPAAAVPVMPPPLASTAQPSNASAAPLPVPVALPAAHAAVVPKTAPLAAPLAAATTTGTITTTAVPDAVASVAKPVAATATAAAAVPAAAPQDAVTQTLRDLPEPIQRAIPAISVGGYIYSKNPADRLLLIDKVLRHEGEELAPGLVLEKLLPKEAVFNYKGYRYRVPY